MDMMQLEEHERRLLRNGDYDAVARKRAGGILQLRQWSRETLLLGRKSGRPEAIDEAFIYATLRRFIRDLDFGPHAVTLGISGTKFGIHRTLAASYAAWEWAVRQIPGARLAENGDGDYCLLMHVETQDGTASVADTVH